MAPPHHRLENALARAEELIVVGQHAAALQILHDAVMSKWLQHNLVALEAIMLKFVEIGVELRRGRTLKDGLHQYRGACMNVNLASLEVVIKHLVELAEAKLAAAQKTAAQVSLDQLDDLEEEDAVLTIGAAKKEGSADRELVAPWFRFLWEVYRLVLDLCRHNQKLEGVYQMVVEHAFRFCEQHQRRSEFRRLCEILRYHLGIIVKYPGQINGIVLNEPESHAIQLGLRFEQLKLATKLELWQEAFRTIEDIHGLFTLARKAAQPSMVIAYYESLGKIFSMSDNYLFLAATWNKLFVIAQAHGNATDEAATTFLLSTLAIPRMSPMNITASIGKDELETKDIRLATFLGLSKVPTAEALFAEVESRQVLKMVSPAIASLHQSLTKDSIDEAEFKQAVSHLASLDVMFVLPIYKNLVSLLCKSASAARDSIPLAELEQLTAFDGFNLEAYILQGCKTGDFSARIDHRAGLVVFEKPCFQRDTLDLCEEMLSSQMSQLVVNIHSASLFVNKRTAAISVITSALAKIDVQHKDNLQRKIAIERKKEQLETLLRQKEQDDARERSKKAQQELESQKARELEDARERERIRLEQEREEIRREQAKLREAEIEAAKAKLQKTKDAEKLIAAFKRLDFLERAIRQEELPLLTKDYERQKVEDRQAYDERVRLIMEKSKAMHTADFEVKQHLSAIGSEYDAYLSSVKEARLARLETRRAELAQELETAKEARRAEILAQLHRKYEVDMQAKKVREEAERHAAERVAQLEAEAAKIREAQKQHLQQQQQQQQQAASAPYRPPTFGASSRPSAFGSSTRPSAFESSTRPSAFESRSAQPAPNAAAQPAASVWRRGDSSTPRDAKSAFGSSRPRQ